jgi:hypothetical protein
MGGVINVILEKGTDHWHGTVYTLFQDGAMNGSPAVRLRYDPTSAGTPTTWGQIDPAPQDYQPIRPHTSDLFPGFKAGGPLIGLLPDLFKISDSGYSRLEKHIFFFGGYNPEFNAYERTLNYGPYGGEIPFSQNTHTDYAYARIDAEVTSRIRLFASWVGQDQKQWGESIPLPDSVQGYYNPVTDCSGTGSSLKCGGNFISPSTYSHTFGYAAPNTILNFGADVTISNNLVSTTRFGYFFENYHDIGYPTGGVFYEFDTNGTTATDTNGTPIATSAPALAESNGYVSGALSQNFTHFNASKATQFDEGIAWFHSGRGGTHNVMFGYQLHRNYNAINQGYSEPDVQIYPGTTQPYTPNDPNVGIKNCASVEAITHYPKCNGTYGNVIVNDYGTTGVADALNHGF